MTRIAGSPSLTAAPLQAPPPYSSSSISSLLHPPSPRLGWLEALWLKFNRLMSLGICLLFWTLQLLLLQMTPLAFLGPTQKLHFVHYANTCALVSPNHAQGSTQGSFGMRRFSQYSLMDDIASIVTDAASVKIVDKIANQIVTCSR